MQASIIVITNIITLTLPIFHVFLGLILGGGGGGGSGMGSITLKCNSLHYNYFGKMCYYITLQLLYFVNVINYITITLPK